MSVSVRDSVQPFRAAEVRTHLARIDTAFSGLREAEGSIHPAVLSHSVSALLGALNTCLSYAVEVGLSTVAIRDCIPATWSVHRESSFIRHVQDWPRGYPGDFGAVNAIVDRAERSPHTSLAGALGRIALASPIAEQHREKLRIQATRIHSTCISRQGPRILSIACGPCRDLEQVLNAVQSSNAEIWIVDHDQAALDDAQQRLRSVSPQVHAVLGDVRQLVEVLGDAAHSGGFDLVYLGGLFDYLPDNTIRRILAVLTPILRQDGRILFTNIAQGNPYRNWIETLANWRLIERSESSMRALLDFIDLPTKSLALDSTGLTWIAEAYA